MVFMDEQTRILRWQPHYWLLAFLVGMVLYAFEAVQIMVFTHFQAPNVSLITQLILTFLFYALWTFVPRLIWIVFDKTDARGKKPGYNFAGLVIVGLVLSVLHLGLLALSKLYMHAQINWGAAQWLTSTAELWLGYSGFWMIAYGLAALVIYLVRARIRRRPSLKIEVRKNGRVFVLMPENILWIEAAGNYIQIYATSGMFTLRGSLAKIEADMGEDDFFRAHRQALVNVKHVNSIKSSADSYAVELTDGTTAPLSRRKMTELKSLLHAR